LKRTLFKSVLLSLSLVAIPLLGFSTERISNLQKTDLVLFTHGVTNGLPSSDAEVIAKQQKIDETQWQTLINALLQDKYKESHFFKWLRSEKYSDLLAAKKAAFYATGLQNNPPTISPVAKGDIKNLGGKLSTFVHDAFWVDRFENFLQVDNELLTENPKITSEGKPFSLVAHSAGTILFFDILQYNLRYIPISDIPKLKSGFNGSYTQSEIFQRVLFSLRNEKVNKVYGSKRKPEFRSIPLITAIDDVNYELKASQNLFDWYKNSFYIKESPPHIEPELYENILETYKEIPKYRLACDWFRSLSDKYVEDKLFLDGDFKNFSKNLEILKELNQKMGKSYKILHSLKYMDDQAIPLGREDNLKYSNDEKILIKRFLMLVTNSKPNPANGFTEALSKVEETNNNGMKWLTSIQNNYVSFRELLSDGVIDSGFNIINYYRLLTHLDPRTGAYTSESRSFGIPKENFIQFVAFGSPFTQIKSDYYAFLLNFSSKDKDENEQEHYSGKKKLYALLTQELTSYNYPKIIFIRDERDYIAQFPTKQEFDQLLGKTKFLIVEGRSSKKYFDAHSSYFTDPLWFKNLVFKL
jgi:hypothetical protein